MKKQSVEKSETGKASVPDPVFCDLKDLSFYTIENKQTHYGPGFRFRSYFNGAAGPWTPYKTQAQEHGECHKRILCAIAWGPYLAGRDLAGEVSHA